MHTTVLTFSRKPLRGKDLSVQTARLNNSGNLHRSKMVIGVIFKRYFRIALYWGIWVESISDVIFSVRGQDQMLKVR